MKLTQKLKELKLTMQNMSAKQILSKIGKGFINLLTAIFLRLTWIGKSLMEGFLEFRAVYQMQKTSWQISQQRMKDEQDETQESK